MRGNGGDTANIHLDIVATGGVDASGNVTFPNFKGASEYVVKTVPPGGVARRSASFFVNKAYNDTIKLSLTLFSL